MCFAIEQASKVDSNTMNHLPTTFQRWVEPVAKNALLAWERYQSGISFDPRAKALVSDPYPLYARLRTEDPVHRMRLLDGWALTKYRDVNAVLRDYRRFSNMDVQGGRVQTGPVSMLRLDPPAHTRLRSLVSQAFTPKAIERLRPKIQRISDRLLDKVADQPRFDLVSSLAYPFPVTVIAEMLGIPAEDLDRFEKWSNDIALSVEPLLNNEEIQRVLNARKELNEYFEEIIALRRRSPRDDMISALIEAEEQGEKLSHVELTTTLTLLLVAGNETTRNLIGNGMLALLSHPEQLHLLRRNPDLLGSAVSETLRYDSPVQLNGRSALEDVEIGGRTIRKGQIVISVIGAANRDPEVFENPDKLDIRRNSSRHLAFGRGIHYCLGAPLAELEGRIALAGILRRFPSIRLAAEPERRPQTVLRGVKSLWVEVDGGPQVA